MTALETVWIWAVTIYVALNEFEMWSHRRRLERMEKEGD